MAICPLRALPSWLSLPSHSHSWWTDKRGPVRRRHQKRLLTITIDEVLRHTRIPPGCPDGTLYATATAGSGSRVSTVPRHLHCRRSERTLEAAAPVLRRPGAEARSASAGTLRLSNVRGTGSGASPSVTSATVRLLAASLHGNTRGFDTLRGLHGRPVRDLHSLRAGVRLCSLAWSDSPRAAASTCPTTPPQFQGLSEGGLALG